MKQLKKVSRIILALASLSMLSTFVLPLWQIQLWAPQYPEGLNMKIWHNKLGGAFDIINGLNHYIGMREIKAEMFPEFHIIGIFIGIFIALGLIAAFIGTRRWLVVFVATAYLYGIAALYDFYRWGYDYGHNLDPHAAIVVPGMSYQPPVLGYKNLLNFTAYSGPDIGGWIIIAVGVIASALLVFEYYSNKKSAGIHAAGTALSALILMTITSCSTTPEPIRYGHDACHGCKMTLTDQRFGAEIVTAKGKVFKFDDLNCLHHFLKNGGIPVDQVAQTVAIDFSHPGVFVDIHKGFFLKNEALKSPMRSDIATFSTEEGRDMVRTQTGGGPTLTWDEACKTF